ncbi:lysozyme [Stenotrophomonas pavanii]|uniref:lysozyme n=1 Tax=Stenotrophomonas pavanii TaxID=487698 RepID=UPI0040428979
MTLAVQLARPLTIKSEGLRLVAYLCPADKWTIGYGHTGPDVKPGLRITAERAVELLDADLAKAATSVRRVVRVPLSAPQEAALIDFVFNLGEGNLATSTLLRKLNAGDYASVPAQLRRWTKGRVKGVLKDLQGLIDRREAEVILWNSEL